jgi:hypothetical protein
VPTYFSENAPLDLDIPLSFSMLEEKWEVASNGFLSPFGNSIPNECDKIRFIFPFIDNRFVCGV